MFIPLLPFSAFPFVGPSHFTVNPFEANAVCARFWTFCTDPFTAMSAYDTMASPLGRGIGNLEGYGPCDGPKGPAAPPARRPRGWPAPIPARSNVSGQGQPGRPRATRRIVL